MGSIIDVLSAFMKIYYAFLWNISRSARAKLSKEYVKPQVQLLVYFFLCASPQMKVIKLVLAVISPKISFPVNMPRQTLRIIKFLWCFSIYTCYNFSTCVQKSDKIKYLAKCFIFGWFIQMLPLAFEKFQLHLKTTNYSVISSSH